MEEVEEAFFGVFVSKKSKNACYSSNLLIQNDKAVTFIYGSPDYGQNELIRIPFSKYFQYLECAVHAVEENSES